MNGVVFLDMVGVLAERQRVLHQCPGSDLHCGHLHHLRHSGTTLDPPIMQLTIYIHMDHSHLTVPGVRKVKFRFAISALEPPKDL